MMNIKKVISIIMVFCVIFSSISIAVFSLSWDGSSAGGSTNAVNGSATGYVIRDTEDANCVVGYRFSSVTSSGAMKVTKVIDVYRNTGNGNNAYANSAKFSTKYNKKQLIANKNKKMTTTYNKTNCLKEKDVGFTTSLPNPNGVGAWQKYEANINKVLLKLGVGSVVNMNYGDKVIIEPLFDICLAGEYQALTVSEISYCGRSMLGGGSVGGAPDNTSRTWGFIANYTNRIWPNKLYTPDGQGLWSGVGAIAGSSKATFDNILSKGYGAGIAYNEKTNSSYVINFNGNGATGGSTPSMSMTRGTAKNLTANGFTRTGYSFGSWNMKNNGTGTAYADKQSVKDLTSGTSITLYAIWKPITYSIVFDGNGNTGGSTASMSMTYNVSKKLTANGFTRMSYKFIGWNTKADGTGTNYTNKQSVKNLSSTNGATVTLYAKWQYDPILAVKECDVYSGAKNNKATLFGISTGNVFDDYEYKTNYPTIGSTVWYNVFFPSEAENIKVKQYVKYNGGSWNTRTVTLSGSNSSSQWFPVQFTGKYKTVKADTAYYEIQAKTDWVDSTGKVLKSGSVKTFYIPIKPVVYRSQVSASGYEGNTVAYNGLSGSGGKLYSGQHIRTAYKYTADNTWSAAEYLRGAMYYHNGSKWVNAYNSNGGFDAAKNKTGIEKSAPITLNSSIESYTVPKTTQNKLRFNLQTWWASDKVHTFEETWYDLPVVQSDVATSKITLIDSQTKVNIDPNNLEAGQSVLVRYTYKNNTDAKVYVEGFRDDKKQISGVYAIPAKSSITVDGYTFTVPNKRNISIWGGVYLEGMGIYNTSYEINGNNNAMTLKCKVKHPLTLIPIIPNADYRETTDVVTSFWLNNSYSDSYTPSENISVKFNVYKGSTVIKTVNKTQAVVPGNSSNLLYFKWKVPSGLNNADVKITGEIIDGGISYNRVSKEYSTIPKITSVTPDTRFEKKAPTEFSLKSPPTETSQSAAWWEWTYSSGKFTKKNYGVEYSNGNAAITPETGSTSAKINSVWHMKSGYGISLSVSNYVSVLFGYTAPSGSAYTNSQFASAKIQEYEYSDARGKYKTLTLSGNSWNFPANGSYGNVHFTPIWYPNGNYTVSVTLSDLWTPAGMITKTVNTNTIKIIDSAYDDWHVGR